MRVSVAGHGCAWYVTAVWCGVVRSWVFGAEQTARHWAAILSG
jgi:hypothetical protein